MGEIFTHRIRVRYAECDAQGVVFNGQYLFLYDVAVTELWRAIGSTWADMVDAGHDLVVAEARLRFREGARFDELIDIRLPIAHLGTTSMVIRPTFTVDDRLIADGEVRHVFVDPATKRKKEMPAAIRAALQPYLMVEG
jgi:acyl-CoA thioester hydrolase